MTYMHLQSGMAAWIWILIWSTSEPLLELGFSQALAKFEPSLMICSMLEGGPSMKALQDFFILDPFRFLVFDFSRVLGWISDSGF